MTQDNQSIESQVAGLEALKSRLSAQSFARSQVDRLHSAAQALHQIATANTGDTPERKAQRVSDAATRYLESIERTKSDISTREIGGFASLSEQFAEAVGMQPDRYANQIVDAFARADHKTKTQMMGQIVEQGDGRSLAAIFEAPEFVTGLPRDQIQKYRDAMEQKHCPKIWEKRQTFNRDFQAAKGALQQAEVIAQTALKVSNSADALKAAQMSRDAESRLAAATE